MNDWANLLRALADDPSEFECEGGTAMFYRQGKEHEFSVQQVPGIGPAVEEHGGHTPLETYVQRKLLDLPTLATQIDRALERANRDRPGSFIEGPALLEAGVEQIHWDAAGRNLREHLMCAEAGTTQLLQLMAAAGQGKTVLLENVAIELARSYQPVQYPTPLLLPVDLLGRYVGNIDDAIAGSLNNTYRFPRMTQRDVALCMARRWLILALDGFDELVARIGVRDAFIRISELLEQLSGAGTIILSARESFFELYEVSASLRSHLRPKGGSYSMSSVKLLPWHREQAVQVFRSVGSEEPERDVDELLEAFAGDTEIVFHPFFLTRLAQLWMRGERFDVAEAQATHMARTRYVIETFVDRESREKWVDRDGNPILDARGHSVVLGAVAEEMWRSGAFWLDATEVRIAAEIGLAELGMPRLQIESVAERAPTHAALLGRDGRYEFLHDRFLRFFLGQRLARHLLANETEPALRLLQARELDPDTIAWTAYFCKEGEFSAQEVVGLLNEVACRVSDIACTTNTGRLFAKLLEDHDTGQEVPVAGLSFVGNPFAHRSYKRIAFEGCNFWHIDLSGTEFVDCSFAQCHFGDIRINGETRLTNCTFAGHDIGSVEAEEGLALYMPDQIVSALEGLGANFVDIEERHEEEPEKKIAPEALKCVYRYVRCSESTCDVAVEEVAEKFGDIADDVAKIGLRHGVFRSVDRNTSGRPKQFVRFMTDRELLLQGQAKKTGRTEIDSFWEEMRQEYAK